jgi:hypothetical protein
MPDGRAVQALFHASAFTRGWHKGYLALYGTAGTLHLGDQPWFTEMHHLDEHGRRHDLQVTPSDDPTQLGCNRLIADFVADVSGTGAAMASGI